MSSPTNVPQWVLAPCSETNATPWIREALEKCRKEGVRRLVIPHGTYHFYRDFAREAHLYISNNDSGIKRIVFFLDHFDDLEIDAQGSLFIFHGYLLPFVVRNSSQITLKNLRVDWDRPFHSEALVTRVDGESVDLEIPAAYPYRIEHGRLVFEQTAGQTWSTEGAPCLLGINNVLEFDSSLKETAFKVQDNYGLNAHHDAVELSPGHVRFRAALREPRPKVGNILALIDCGRECPAITIADSSGVTIEGVSLHHASGMGVIAQTSRDITLRKCVVAPAPETGRMISLQADATHFVCCGGHILLEDCEFSHQLDDAGNFHGVYTPVIRRLSDRSAIIRLHHFQQRGMQPYQAGHAVELITAPGMAAKGANELASVSYLNSEHILLEFRHDLPPDFGPGFAVGSLYWQADVTIRRTRVHSNRARGYLVTTGGKFRVEENYFHTAGAAILIESDACGWHESGPVRDVLIRGNVFENCNYGVWNRATIDIAPQIPAGEREGKIIHRNIRIEGNEFRTFHDAIVKAYCTEGLVIKGNAIIHSEAYGGWKPSGQPFDCPCCSGVEISENSENSEKMNLTHNLAWMEQEIRRILQNARVVSRDGVVCYSPAGGRDVYARFYLRDFAYIVESVPWLEKEEVLPGLAAFVDRIDPETRAVPETLGIVELDPKYACHGARVPVADSPMFLAKLFCRYAEHFGDLEYAEKTYDQVADALKAVRRSPHGALVWIDPAAPYTSYGFQDTIAKSGEDLFCSILLFESLQKMAVLAKQLGRTLDAEVAAAEAENIRRALERLYSPEHGLYWAATHACHQIDVWGSIYGLACGAFLPNRIDSVRSRLWETRESWLFAGQVRHLFEPELWDSVFFINPEYTSENSFQNGAYWATPTGWLAEIFERQEAGSGSDLLHTLTEEMRQNGIWECLRRIDGYRRVRDNLSSIVLPYASGRRLAERS